MRKNLCLLLVVTLAFTAGCDRLKGDSPIAKLNGDDPVAKLKSHAVCLEKHLREENLRNEKLYAIKADVIKDVSFDVRKTDSLVSPFVGTIRWVATSSHVGGDFEYEMTLVYQENQWVLKEVQWRVGSDGEWKDDIDERARINTFFSRARGETPSAELTDKGTILRGWSEKLVCN